MAGVEVLVGEAEDGRLGRQRLERLPADSALHAIILIGEALLLIGALGGLDLVEERGRRLRIDEEQAAGLVLLREVFRARGVERDLFAVLGDDVVGEPAAVALVVDERAAGIETQHVLRIERSLDA